MRVCAVDFLRRMWVWRPGANEGSGRAISIEGRVPAMIYILGWPSSLVCSLPFPSSSILPVFSISTGVLHTTPTRKGVVGICSVSSRQYLFREGHRARLEGFRWGNHNWGGHPAPKGQKYHKVHGEQGLTWMRRNVRLVVRIVPQVHRYASAVDPVERRGIFGAEIGWSRNSAQPPRFGTERVDR